MENVQIVIVICCTFIVLGCIAVSTGHEVEAILTAASALVALGATLKR